MRPRLVASWIAVALVACKSGDAKKPAAGSAAGSAAKPAAVVPSEPRIPGGPVPVTLPVIDAAQTRRVGSAKAFVTLTAGKQIAVGVLAPGSAPYAGVTLAADASVADQVDAALAGRKPSGSGAVAGGGPGSLSQNPYPYYDDYDGAQHKLTATFDVLGPLEVLVLADTAASGHALYDVLAALTDHRVGLAVAGIDAPDALAFRFGEPAVPDWEAAGAFVEITAEGVQILDRYGGVQPVAKASSGGVDRAAVVAAITAAKDRYSSSRSVSVTLTADAPVQSLIDVIAAAAMAKFPTVTIVDRTPQGYDAIPDGALAGVPKVTIEAPDVGKGLDKAVVRRYLTRFRSQISFCYEKRLLVVPTLSGRVSTSLSVSDDGTVRMAFAIGVDAEVDSCIEGVLRVIEFPKPKGGRFVDVSCGIMLEPTGG